MKLFNYINSRIDKEAERYVEKLLDEDYEQARVSLVHTVDMLKHNEHVELVRATLPCVSMIYRLECLKNAYDYRKMGRGYIFEAIHLSRKQISNDVMTREIAIKKLTK